MFPCAEEGRLFVAKGQVERTDCDAAPTLIREIAVGHRMNAGKVECDGGVCARQHGSGEVSGGRHNVGTDEGVLNHLAVDRLVVAPRPAVANGNRAIRGAEERASAAGKIGDLQGLHRLRVRPIYVEPRDS